MDGKIMLRSGLLMLGIACLFWFLSSGVSAFDDTIELEDAAHNKAMYFGNQAQVWINATDGNTDGTTVAIVSAVVTDDANISDTINVDVKDDGTGAPWDVANDGTYWGFFTIMFDNGNDGATSSDALDMLDLPEGGTFTVEVDIDSNTDPGTAQASTDFTFPTISDITPADNTVVKDTIQITATVIDPHLNTSRIGYQVGVDETPFWMGPGTGADQYEADLNTDNYTVGKKVIKIFAVDEAGNNATVEFNISIDRVVPQVVVNLAQDYVSTSYYLNVTVTDSNLDASTIAYKLDGGTSTLIPNAGGNDYEVTISMASVTEGSHVLAIVASDIVGNMNTTESVVFIVDRTTPVVAVASVDNKVVNDEYTLNINVSDVNLDAAKVKYKLDDGIWKGMQEVLTDPGTFKATIQVTVLGLAEGSHKVTFNVSDLAGNYDTSKTVNFTVDKTNPVVTLLTEGDVFVKSTYHLQAEVADANLKSIVYVLGATEPKPMTEVGPGTNGGTIYEVTINVGAYPDNTYVIRVEATDMAGNNNLNAAPTIYITVDKVAPTVTGVVSEVQGEFILEVTIFDTNLDPDNITFTLDGGAELTFDMVGANKFEYTFGTNEYAEGHHNITIYAIDLAGNMAEESILTIYMDPPPQSENVKATDNKDGTVTLEWSANGAADLDHYLIYYTTDFTKIGSFNSMTLLNGSIDKSAMSHIISGLDVDTKYYIAVTAVDTSGFMNTTVIYDSVTPTIHEPIATFDVEFSLDKSIIHVNEEIAFTITVENTGDLDATGVVVQIFDSGAPISGASQTIDIAIGETKNITIKMKFSEKGAHEISIRASHAGKLGGEEKRTLDVLEEATGGNGGGVAGGLGDMMFIILILIVVVVAVVVIVVMLKRKSPMDKELEKEEKDLGIGRGQEPPQQQAQQPQQPAQPAAGPKLQPPPKPQQQAPPPQQQAPPPQQQAPPPAQPPQ